MGTAAAKDKNLPVSVGYCVPTGLAQDQDGLSNAFPLTDAKAAALPAIPLVSLCTIQYLKMKHGKIFLFPLPSFLPHFLSFLVLLQSSGRKDGGRPPSNPLTEASTSVGYLRWVGPAVFGGMLS